MPHDPVLLQDTKAWLVKAANDLRGAEISLSADPPLLEDVVFHCQQAAEKTLKAFLTFHNHPFRKTHNLEEIGEACLTIDDSLRACIDEVVPLTEYAWAFRYPGDPIELSSEESHEALKIARCLYQEILQRVVKQAHP